MQCGKNWKNPQRIPGKLNAAINQSIHRVHWFEIAIIVSIKHAEDPAGGVEQSGDSVSDFQSIIYKYTQSTIYCLLLAN